METSTNKIVLAWNAWTNEQANSGFMPVQNCSEIVDKFREFTDGVSGLSFDGINICLYGYNWTDDVFEDANGTILCRVYGRKDKKFVVMKYTKFISRMLDENFKNYCVKFPEQVRVFLREHLCRIAVSEIGNEKFTLHVDRNFERIYDRLCCKSFGSCMAGKGYEVFYESVDGAKAAYLTDDEGMVVARAILFGKAHLEDSGIVIRVLERQYAEDKDTKLMQILVSKLISGGHIDAYREIGSGYNDTQAFVDLKGKMIEESMYIEHSWNEDSYIPYMDSFAYYDDIFDGVLYNDSCGHYETLKDTDGTVHYNSYRDVYTFAHLVDVITTNGVIEMDEDDESLYEIDGQYYLTDEIDVCPMCGEPFFIGDDRAEYSVHTDERYCSDTCRIEADQAYADEHGMYYSEILDDIFDTEDEMLESEDEYKRVNWYHSPFSSDGHYMESLWSVKNNVKDNVEKLNRQGKFVRNLSDVTERIKKHEHLTMSDLEIVGIEEGYMPRYSLFYERLKHGISEISGCDDTEYGKVMNTMMRYMMNNNYSVNYCRKLNDFVHIDEVPYNCIVIGNEVFERDKDGVVPDWTFAQEICECYPSLFNYTAEY